MNTFGPFLCRTSGNPGQDNVYCVPGLRIVSVALL